MARDVIDRQLTVRAGRTEFAVAARADDPGIRQLLRNNPMPGQISLSLEREPDYFTDAGVPSEIRRTVIAREEDRVVCMGSYTIRQRFINGVSCRVGYLGGLRLDASCAGRFDLPRRGYGFLRELQAEVPAEFYFTSIACDNRRARAFLERGFPGMPTYEPIGDFVTLLLSTRLRPATPANALGRPDSWEGLVTLLNNNNCQHQLAPCWAATELQAHQSLGLGLDNFCLTESSACAAIWDQRRFKQTVIRGYSSPLKQTRPLLNLASRFIKGIRLPAIGETLANAFVLNLTAMENPEVMSQLVKSLLGTAACRGMELLTLGFAASDLRLSWLRKNFSCREYHSRLYLVRWPGLGGGAKDLDEKVLCPEVALL